MSALSVLIVAGASGVGKTATLQELESRQLPGVRCYYFDSIGVPSTATMEREHGSGERWQQAATEAWLSQLSGLSQDIEVAVLEGQTRPSYVFAAAKHAEPRKVRVVLFDCAAPARSL